MATHPKAYADYDSDMDLTCLAVYTVPHRTTTHRLVEQVQDLQLDVEKLRKCLNDSLELQRSLLEQ